MKTKITTEEMPDYYTVERIKEELYAIEYNLDQPRWMCGSYLMNKWLLRKLVLKSKLARLTDEKFSV